MESQNGIEELSFGKSMMNFLYHLGEEKAINPDSEESLQGLTSIEHSFL